MAGLPADLTVCQSNMAGSRSSGPGAGDLLCLSVMPLSSVTLVRGLLFQPLDHRQNKGQAQLSGYLSVFQRKSCGT